MSVNVGMVVEQMWQPVPGGSGRYIVEVAARLADQGVRAIGIAARRGAGEPAPNEVGLTILEPLSKLDAVAYLRFASVYQAFENLEDFEEAIARLREDRINP